MTTGIGMRGGVRRRLVLVVCTAAVLAVGAVVVPARASGPDTAAPVPEIHIPERPRIPELRIPELRIPDPPPIIDYPLPPPGPVPIPEVFVNPLPQPVIDLVPERLIGMTRLVTVHAVLTADDEGNGAATIREEDIRDILLARANEHWQGAVRFTLGDVVEVSSSELYYDCVPRPGDCSVNASADAREAYALQSELQDELVVFFRNGGDGAFSCSSCHFVVMPGGIAPQPSPKSAHNLFGHEVGHYFWVDHTFPGNQPDDLSEVRDMMKQYVEAGHHHNEALDVFDADRATVSDTPPDPGERLWKNLKGDECSDAPGDHTHFFTVDLEDGFGPRAYSLTPDRSNIMSYFQHCLDLGPHRASTDQKERAAWSIASRNRAPLYGADPVYVGMRPVPLDRVQNPDPNWEAGARSMVTFEKGNDRYVFYTVGDRGSFIFLDQGNYKFDIDALGRAKELNDWDGKWDPAFSSIASFELGGEPYLLAYNPNSKVTRIYQLDPSDEGLSLTWTDVNHLTVPWAPSPTWTQFSSFESGGQTYGFRYAGENGRAEIFRFLEGGKGITTTWQGSLSPGSTALAALSIDGTPHALLYDKTFGFTRIVRLAPAGATVAATTVLPADRSWILPFDRGPEARFVTFGPTVGPGTGYSTGVYRIRNELTGPSIGQLTSLPSPKDVDLAMMVRMRGLWNVFRYARSTGEMTVESIIQ